MQRATPTAILSAVAIAAAFGLGGCSQKIDPPPTAPVSLTPITTPEVVPTAPLPPPEALIDVMTRLTDPKVPGTDKLNLIQYSTPEDAAVLDKFDKAVSDGGYRPLGFEANDVQWAQGDAGSVLASMVIKTANPQAGDNGSFKFPMEFTFAQDTWQLTRDTADTLLEFGGAHPPPPGPPPPPAEPPPPGPSVPPATQGPPAPPTP